VEPYGFTVIDAGQPIPQIFRTLQRQMRDIVMKHLGDALKNGILHLPAGEEFHAQTTAPPVL